MPISIENFSSHSDSNRKTMEEEHPHILQEKEITLNLQSTQQNSTKTLGLNTSNSRPKNPIIAIFRVLSLARKTMKDVAQSSKEQTRKLKKHWEMVSQEVSNHHDTAANQNNSLGKWSMGIGLVCTILPQYLKGSIPQDTPIKGSEKITTADVWDQLKDKFIEKKVKYLIL